MPTTQPPTDATDQIPEETPCRPKKTPGSRKSAVTNSAPNAARKRSKTSDDGDEDEEEEKKRSRGRPRLDTKDETAADVSISIVAFAQQYRKHVIF